MAKDAVAEDAMPDPALSRSAGSLAVLFAAPRWTVLSFISAAFGLLVAGYLTYVHYQPDALVCAVGGGCHSVQNSQYSVILGVPIAALGVGMYLAALTLGVIRWWRPALVMRLTGIIFAMTLAAVIYYGYLTYLELFVINAICQWCVISAVLTVGILTAESTGLWKMFGDDL